MSNAQVNYVGQYGGQFTGSGAVYNNASQLVLPGGVLPVILYGTVASNDATKQLAFYKAGMASQIQYKTPNNASFISVGLYHTTGSAAAAHQLAFGHDTNSFSNKTTITGTAIVYAPSTASADWPIYFTTTNAQLQWLPFPVVFPSGVYPLFLDNTGGAQLNLMLIGYEA